jgi:hypothetical protein
MAGHANPRVTRGFTDEECPRCLHIPNCPPDQPVRGITRASTATHPSGPQMTGLASSASR